MASANVLLDMDGGVAVVTLAKPPHNLLDDRMAGEIAGTFADAVSRGARAILLRSAMRHFCAGADLAQFTDTSIQSNRARWDEIMSALEDVYVPTVAAVNGGALGGGLELALCCDMIVAADTAFLGQVEVAVGLLPLLGGTQRLAQRCGVARAKEIAMFGRRHDPAALERWGVINLVVAEAELASVSMAWARQLAAGPTVALHGIKLQANLAGRGGVDAADAQQIEINEMVWHSNDRRRGFEAFKATGVGTAVFAGD